MRRGRPPILLVLGTCAAASGLGGCATHVKGSWACALQPGVVCGSIAAIDQGAPNPASPRAKTSDPVIDGAIPARLWGQGGWSAGAIASAPVREPDPIVKVAVAPWIDGEGDFHAGAEIFAVMRQGGWFIAPANLPARRVDLARLGAAPPPRAAPAPPVSNRAATDPVSTHDPAPAAQGAKASQRP